MYVAGTALLKGDSYHFIIQPAPDMIPISSPTCILGWSVRAIKEKKNKDGSVNISKPTMLVRTITKGFKLDGILFELKIRELYMNEDAFYDGAEAEGKDSEDPMIKDRLWCGEPEEGEDPIVHELTREVWPSEVKATRKHDEGDDVDRKLFDMPYKVWKQAAKHVLS